VGAKDALTEVELALVGSDLGAATQGGGFGAGGRQLDNRDVEATICKTM